MKAIVLVVIAFSLSLATPLLYASSKTTDETGTINTFLKRGE